MKSPHFLVLFYPTQIHNFFANMKYTRKLQVAVLHPNPLRLQIFKFVTALGFDEFYEALKCECKHSKAKVMDPTSHFTSHIAEKNSDELTKNIGPLLELF